MSMEQAILRAQDVSKTYTLGDTQVRALHGVNLEIHHGEMVVILGPSGSGKSTLLHILGGLDVPSAGVVRYRDHELTSASESELTRYRREHVGFVFQFYNLIPSLTALENVALVTEIALNPMEPGRALALVGLSDRENHFPGQLSGGEQQRVAIARAIAKQPDILLCDEPTGALDAVTGRVVLAALERINRDVGATTLLITHNSVIGSLADRVVRLSSGTIADVRQNATRAPAETLDW